MIVGSSGECHKCRNPNVLVQHGERDGRGRRLHRVVCPNCGERLEAAPYFCGACNLALGDELLMRVILSGIFRNFNVKSMRN